MKTENKNCCCQCCKKQEIDRLKEDIKLEIKFLKSDLNLGFFDSGLFDMTYVAETRSKQLYEKVKKLRELSNEA